MQINTKRLILKSVEKEDFNNLFQLFSDKDVMKFSLEGPFSKEKMKDFFNKMLDDEKQFSLGNCLALYKKTKEFMGVVGIYWHFSKKPHLAFRFLKEFWNKGFATEALNAFLTTFFKIYPGKQIEVLVEEENIPSIKVLEKLNFQFFKKTVFEKIDALEYFLKFSDFFSS